MKILIIGATSAIAEETARIWAREGQHLYLVARNAERLRTIADDLAIRGAGAVYTDLLDVNAFDQHEALIDKALETLGGIDRVLIAHGILGEQKKAEEDFHLALGELNTNAISLFSLLTHIANRLETQRYGSIAVIGSVAGDRGRQSNYIYGTAKGAVALFLQGLRQRLYKSGVHVLTVKPGFIDTPMTNQFSKGLLWSRPEAVARAIDAGIRKRRSVIYVPAYWRLIMAVIRSIPEVIMKRVVL